jgi:O-antigen ligase
MWTRHHILLSVLLLGNAVAFAGVDPMTRTVTALLVLVLMIDLRTLPAVPRFNRWALWGLCALVAVQLTPLPESIRGVIQPGFRQVLPPGWAPLSLAPWATVQVAAMAVVLFAIALTAARLASTRTGLPAILGLLAITGALLAMLGLASEAAAPEKVLLVRANTSGGAPYGPFINPNHFALSIELTFPAAVALLAVGVRQTLERGAAKHRSLVLGLAACVTSAVGCAALIRSGSRGGMLFLVVAAATTSPLWRRPRNSWRWPWMPVVGVVVVLALTLASTRLALVRDEFSRLLVLEGVEGNTRWDLWRGTWSAWQRSPLVGSGLGSYRYVIGLDKPATGDQILEQAHNDWLEWLACGGVAGVAVLAMTLGCVAAPLTPPRVRRLRFEFRYPLAGAAFALLATGLHETIGFGLQTPLNGYLLAAWVGVVWGVTAEGRGPTLGEGDS